MPNICKRFIWRDSELSDNIGRYDFKSARRNPWIVNWGSNIARNNAWSVGAKKLKPRQVVFWAVLGSVMRTEKSRFQRSLLNLRDLMQRIRHLPIREQVENLNRVLRGNYAYYGIAGNIRALQRTNLSGSFERYWRKMLSSRSRKGNFIWESFGRIKEAFPLLRPRIAISYKELQSIAVL